MSKAPYNATGRLFFKSGKSLTWCTAQLFYNATLLTAAHCAWDPDNKWSSKLMFCYGDPNAVHDRKSCSKDAKRIVPQKWCILQQYMAWVDYNLRRFVYDFSFMKYDKVSLGIIIPIKSITIKESDIVFLKSDLIPADVGS